ncbi:JAB domain-containing protein [Facklamia miroungae]|uniref:JAB domain-containing protein n=1 Tax=Facklamia miroungae TaxID=120956 RepID=UPI00144461AA|nr:JAB domain-containing protein [Facklamia miroungae]NKZ30294.1 JAB domain-containing protein [Facklamia miroungae]
MLDPDYFLIPNNFTKTDKFKIGVIKEAITDYDIAEIKGRAVNSPDEVTEFLNLYYKAAKSEKVVALFMDSKNQVRGIQEIFIGNVKSSILSPTEIMCKRSSTRQRV